MGRIDKKFKLPLRVTTTTEKDLVLSDAADEDVLLIPSSFWGQDDHSCLEELAKTYNAAQPADPTPAEEAAIRRFTEADYRRRLRDNYAGQVFAALMALPGYDYDFKRAAQDAFNAAEWMISERSRRYPSDAGK